MVMVVQDSPQNEMFTARLFGEPVRELVEYTSQLFDQASTYLSDRARQWVQHAPEIYQKVNYDNLMRTTRALGRQLRGAFRDDVIRPIWDIGEMQTTGPVMQRWIMAEPTVREMYHARECEGYQGQYIDQAPGYVGELHYDYRRVMDGVVVVDEENNTWSAASYLEPLYEGDRNLLVDEQADIAETWKHLRSHLAKGEEDPTSRWNGSL